MAKPLTIKDALKLWEEKTKKNPAEAEVVKLMGMMPSIVKIDPGLNVLAKVVHLSLGSNQIDKIANLNGLPNLKILSLGRNNIKKIEALEPVSETLEELWISYNQIEKINGIECCKKLRVLYMTNNKVKAWDGIDKLRDLQHLVEVTMVGNPLEEKGTADGNWRDEVAKRFLQFKKLDGKPIIRDDEVDAAQNAEAKS